MDVEAHPKLMPREIDERSAVLAMHSGAGVATLGAGDHSPISARGDDQLWCSKANVSEL